MNLVLSHVALYVVHDEEQKNKKSLDLSDARVPGNPENKKLANKRHATLPKQSIKPKTGNEPHFTP